MTKVTPEQIAEAVARRNVDEINGKLRLANGKDVTEDNVNDMLYGPYATRRLEEHNKWYARAEALADDAPIEDVRKATWGDSCAVTKQDLLRVLDANAADRKQYEADVLLALRYVEQLKQGATQMNLLVLLTTATQPHLNTSRNVDSLEAGAELVRTFIESNDLGSRDLRGDFGETYETRERHDGHGDEAKHIGYFNFNGTFSPREEDYQ